MVIRMSKRSRSDDETAVYLVKCTDGQVAVSEERMHSLCAQMPVLESILFGHSSMKAVSHDVKLERLDFGHRVPRTVKLHDDFAILSQDFSRLLACVLGLEGPSHLRYTVPQSHEHQDRLLQTMMTLGGCEALETKLKEARFAQARKAEEAETASRRATAMKPSTDAWHTFEWRTVGPSSLSIEPGTLNNLQGEGFEYSTHEMLGDKAIHFFRRIAGQVTGRVAAREV